MEVSFAKRRDGPDGESLEAIVKSVNCVFEGGLSISSIVTNTPLSEWTSGFAVAFAASCASGAKGEGLVVVWIISAGEIATFKLMGFLTLKEPIELYSSLLEVKPPTGEPDAGNPLVRFGGGGAGNSTVPSYPYPKIVL